MDPAPGRHPIFPRTISSSGGSQVLPPTEFLHATFLRSTHCAVFLYMALKLHKHTQCTGLPAGDCSTLPEIVLQGFPKITYILPESSKFSDRMQRHSLLLCSKLCHIVSVPIVFCTIATSRNSLRFRNFGNSLRYYIVFCLHCYLSVNKTLHIIKLVSLFSPR